MSNADFSKFPGDFVGSMNLIEERAYALRLGDYFGERFSGIEAIGIVGRMFPDEYEMLIACLEKGEITLAVYVEGMTALIDEFKVRRAMKKAKDIIEGVYA